MTEKSRYYNQQIDVNLQVNDAKHTDSPIKKFNIILKWECSIKIVYQMNRYFPRHSVAICEIRTID